MSSPTLALVRKDSPWLLAFLAVGTVLACGVFLEAEFKRIFVVPEAEFAAEFEFLLVPCTVLLALVASLGETLRSTGALLRHRPLSPARVFWTRNLAALGVIAAWTVLGTLAVWLRELVLGAGGACLDPSRYGALAAMTAGLTLDYALVVLAAALPVRWIHRAWIGGVLLFLRYAAQSTLGFLDPSWSTCLLVFALAAVAALVVAARCEATGHDADHPTPGRALAPAAAACTVAGAFFLAIAAGGWQKLALQPLPAMRPCLGLADDGPGLLLGPDFEGLCELVDARGLPTGRRVRFEDDVFFRAPKPESADFDALALSVLYPPFAWYQNLREEQVTRRVRLLPDAVRVVEERSPDRRRCWTLPLPPGSTGRGAGLFELKNADKEPLFLMAPEVGGLWLVSTETPPRLVPQTLPDGDRPVRQTFGRDEAGETLWAIAGQTGCWYYQAGAWQAVPSALAGRAATHTVLDEAPLRPEVELRLASGTTLRHRYGLERAGEKLCAALAGLSSTLRPLPFALLGASTDYAAVARDQPDEALLVLDPLLGGGYAWLLWPNLACTAFFMGFVFRQLRRHGVGRARAVAWTLAVLVAGVIAGSVLVRLFEPRRAWRRPAHATPPAPLLHAA